MTGAWEATARQKLNAAVAIDGCTGDAGQCPLCGSQDYDDAFWWAISDEAGNLNGHMTIASALLDGVAVSELP